MRTIYRVTIHGRTFESGDLKQLLSRAVTEKRSLDWRMRHYRPIQVLSNSCYGGVSLDRIFCAAQPG